MFTCVNRKKKTHVKKRWYVRKIREKIMELITVLDTFKILKFR